MKPGLLKLNPVIWIMGLVSLFTDLSGQMIVPILPLYLTTVLHVQMGTLGLIEGIAESTASVLKLFSGWLTDRLGRRKQLMVLGYGLSNLVKPLFAFSGSWLQVMTIRFADRFGKGIRVSPRDALIADSSTPEERGRAFGFRRSMDTLGAALGPLAAFAILAMYEGNYRLVFLASIVPGAIAMLLLIFLLKEKTPAGKPKHRKLPKISFKKMDRKFIWFCLIYTLFMLGNFSDAFLALRAHDVGMSAAVIPLAFFAFNMVTTIFSMPVGILSDRIGRRPVLIAGFVIFAVIYVGFGFADHVAWIWVLFCLYGLYYAFTDGIQKAYIADIVPEGQRGTAMGTFNALSGLASLPASVIAGVMWQSFGPAAAFSVSGGAAILSALLLLLVRV